jgi:hypothetical protein
MADFGSSDQRLFEMTTFISNTPPMGFFSDPFTSTLWQSSKPKYFESISFDILLNHFQISSQANLILPERRSRKEQKYYFVIFL